MCTAFCYSSDHFYFGRTLDFEHSFGQQVVLTPRSFPFRFRHTDEIGCHYAMLGMAVKEEFPLYFDALNERGLAMAGLHFPGNAHYFPENSSYVKNAEIQLASFELIPYILSSCSCIEDSAKLFKKICITDTAYSPSLPPSPLHWILYDGRSSLVIEPMKDGLRTYRNPVGILTNEPPFPFQLYNLSSYLHLSPNPQKQRFTDLDLSPFAAYSRGMGAIGLPGDFSSASRFVRGAFNLLNAVKCEKTEDSIIQYFHIAASVEQIKGCVRLDDGKFVHTIYTSCCDLNDKRYYYTTYENRSIVCFDMDRKDGDTIQTFS